MDFVTETLDLDVVVATDQNVGQRTRQCLLHLELNEFLNVLVRVLGQVDSEQYPAGVVQVEGLLAAGDLSGHGEEVESFTVLHECQGQQ